MHEVQERIDKSLHDGEELVTHFTERINQMDSIFARFDKGLEKLGNLDKLYESVEQMVEDQRQETIALHLRLDEMDRRITHEREERIDATRKGVRTDLLLSQRLEGLTDASR
jgi:chromosome condensin MukBEF ATPase and DNA-binding subunit MukB